MVILHFSGKIPLKVFERDFLSSLDTEFKGVRNVFDE